MRLWKLELWSWPIHFGHACRSGRKVGLLEIFLEWTLAYLFGTLVVLLFRTLRSTIWTGRKNEMMIPAVGVRKGKKKEDRFDRRYDGRMKKKV